MIVKDAEELGKRWDIWDWCGGGKDKLRGIVTTFFWPGEWGNIGEVEGFKDLGVHIFWSVGVYPKVERLGVGDKWRTE